MTNSLPNFRKGEIQLTENATQPFQKLHADHFGQLKDAVDGLNTFWSL